jgi:hypothetical protein
LKRIFRKNSSGLNKKRSSAGVKRTFSHAAAQVEDPTTTESKLAAAKSALKKELLTGGSDVDDDSSSNFGGGYSSGSDGDTDGGYAGSASSADVRGGSNECCLSSPSLSVSSVEYDTSRSNNRHKKAEQKEPQPLLNGVRPLLLRQTGSILSMSSDLADFASGATERQVAEIMAALRRDNKNDRNDANSSAESISSCSAVYGGSSCSDENADYPLDYKHAAQAPAQPAQPAQPAHHRQHQVQVHHHSHLSHHHHMDRKHRASQLFQRSIQVPSSSNNNNNSNNAMTNLPSRTKQVPIAVNENVKKKSGIGGRNKYIMSNHHFKKNSNDNKPRILMVGSDVMAHILTFLEPP